nr:immunoglobulin heavy chain junction region [Mus musculus]
CARGGFDVW